MKNLRSYSFKVSILCILFLNFHSKAQNENNYASYRDIYFYGYNAGYNSGYEDGYEECRTNKLNQPDFEFNATHIGSIAFGVGITMLCGMSYQYLHALSNHEAWDENEGSGPSQKNRPLPFTKRLEILNSAFRPAEKINLNLPLIASMTCQYSRAKLDKFLTILKRSTTEYNINFAAEKNVDTPYYTTHAITMNDIDRAIDELQGGSQMSADLDAKNILQTAIHESGHALAIAHVNTRILCSISIVHRNRSLGRCISLYTDEQKSWTVEDYKDNIMVALCGGMAEQIFGFDRSWYEGYYPAGAEQAFDECRKLAQNKNISKGLADLLAIPGAVSDMIYARELALRIAQEHVEAEASKNRKEAQYGDIQNYQCVILEACYQKALKIMMSHKSKIETIAQLLMRHDILSGEKVYEICKITRPRYTHEL